MILFSAFILAPAASGKGALQSSKELANKYHEEVLKNSREQKKEYDLKMAAYKKAQRFQKKDDNTQEEIPEEPPFKVVFIPANTSNAKLSNTYNKMMVQVLFAKPKPIH